MFTTLFQSPIGYILVAALLVLVMWRRLKGEPAQGKRMVVLPGILIVIGLAGLGTALTRPLDVAYLVCTVALALIIGALRGLTLRVSERDGVAFVQYTWLTIVLWGVSIASKIGFAVLWHSLFEAGSASSSSSYMLVFGASLLAEGLVTLYRALHGTGAILWATAKNGKPATPSTQFNAWQAQVHSRQQSGR